MTGNWADSDGGQRVCGRPKETLILLHDRQPPRPSKALSPQVVEVRSRGKPVRVEGSPLVAGPEPPVDEALYHPSHHVVDDQRDFRGLRQSELDLCFRQT